MSFFSTVSAFFSLTSLKSELEPLGIASDSLTTSPPLLMVSPCSECFNAISVKDACKGSMSFFSTAGAFFSWTSLKSEIEAFCVASGSLTTSPPLLMVSPCSDCFNTISVKLSWVGSMSFFSTVSAFFSLTSLKSELEPLGIASDSLTTSPPLLMLSPSLIHAFAHSGVSVKEDSLADFCCDSVGIAALSFGRLLSSSVMPLAFGLYATTGVSEFDSAYSSGRLDIAS